LLRPVCHKIYDKLKAYEIKTGLDKLKRWVGGTKQHVDIICGPSVSGESRRNRGVLVKPEVTATASSCCKPVIGNQFIQEFLKPLKSFAVHSFGLLSWVLQPWVNFIIIYYLCLLGIHLGNMMLESFCKHKDFVLILQLMMINSGLVWCGMQMHDGRQIRTVPSSCRALGLMLVRKVFIMDMPSMILFAPKEPDMSFTATVEKHLMKRRPPQRELRKIKKLRRKWLSTALRMAALVPVIGVLGQSELNQKLQSFVATDGLLRTRDLPQYLKKMVREDLTSNSRDLLSIKGVHMSVADTGSSSGLVANKSRFTEGTYKTLSKPINVGGIAGGLQVIGKGELIMEFLDTKGGIKRIQREVYHAPNVPVDLLPPQAIMSNGK